MVETGIEINSGEDCQLHTIESGVVNTGAIFLKSLQLQGMDVGSREMLEEMNRAITLHKMRPIVRLELKFNPHSPSLLKRTQMYIQ
ncbi:hypothetical protein CEN50_01810 [Fischerella thermalis CCMEE 5268]|uniref:Uncharacterized protein n=1 Tax=Fischerella thermalis CCMEE 5268 TaxID=2019662 RepID=A0A2N6KLQ5_9CYAN|nr:hypothetical protein [Fischerella thermalis]PMB00802.1 hypothetical protein CEN50_01810 [Fischerella thermalis CCMEE 5268]